MIAVGLMSGTSLDGIDAALVEIRPRGNGYDFDLLAFESAPFDREMRIALACVMPPNRGSASEVAELHRLLGACYAESADRVRGARKVDFAAMHGQTVYHDGPRGVTLQLGSPYFLRDRIGATVCFDFRSADCALGGHGAPLVPYVDSILLTSQDEDRVALNIGGIANLTFLPRGGEPTEALAFDTGPGNMLIDSLVQIRTRGTRLFDEDGALAAAGSVSQAALQPMLGDAYFAQEAPKSTGRERFGSQFLQAHNDALQALSLEDAAATLTELTAVTIADALKRVAPSGTRVLLSGGGARNRSLIAAIQKCLSAYRVETMADMHLRSDAKEAVAFAILGYETLRGRPASLPRVTGASRAAVLGAIAPYKLAELLQRVEAECAV
jgi:anhydro-N-acetylmuramic acid kinase